MIKEWRNEEIKKWRHEEMKQWMRNEEIMKEWRDDKGMRNEGRNQGRKESRNQVDQFNSFVCHWISVRYFEFKADRMRSPASLPFEECVLSVLGLPGGKDPPSSMLSSLASELAFNSLRDTCRRHAKQERTSPAAMHAVAWKSASVNKFGCETLSLSDQDWSSPLKCLSDQESHSCQPSCHRPWTWHLCRRINSAQG